MAYRPNHNPTAERVTMPKHKPFIKPGERIRPLTARQFAFMVHYSPDKAILYRVFESKESARVSTHTYRSLDVFEGLGIDFEVRPMSRSRGSKFGVYGVSVARPPLSGDYDPQAGSGSGFPERRKAAAVR
jgi:hypothetical protein